MAPFEKLMDLRELINSFAAALLSFATASDMTPSVANLVSNALQSGCLVRHRASSSDER